MNVAQFSSNFKRKWRVLSEEMQLQPWQPFYFEDTLLQTY